MAGENAQPHNEGASTEGQQHPPQAAQGRRSNNNRRNRKRRRRVESNREEGSAANNAVAPTGVPSPQKKQRTEEQHQQAPVSSSSSSSSAAGPSAPIGPAAQAAPAVPMFNRDDLLCAVCMEYPESQIFQCANGHLLCNACHQRIVDSEKSVCPSCRVKMSADQPNRNLFAESVLANVQVTCSNAGCSDKLLFGKLKEHVEKLCEYRPALCKYSILACNWRGIHRDLAEHEENCEIRNMKGKKLVKLMKENDSKKKGESLKQMSAQEAQTKVVQLLSSRARDIVIRDVMLEKDDLCDVICSKTFMALGYAWEVILNRDRASKKPSLNIRMISMGRRKLKLTFFVLKGPYVELDIPPAIANAEFKKRSGQSVHQSCHCILQTDEDTSKRILEGETLHLRIGFVDQSRGVSRWFTNQNDEPRDYSSDEDDEFEDEEDRHHHRRHYHHHDDSEDDVGLDSDSGDDSRDGSGNEYSIEIETDSDISDASVLDFL
eukprot:TRINITY_DN10384_c0_g2_i1.p1 TRINITY_DN10384_c0_g2~~TRINITY_DN10384_c0_g2_i1.p1  ORF type:complete len:490 (-),score=129.06 TRINITY_DN10384_c0_g2_i1:1155-2624(-)